MAKKSTTKKAASSKQVEAYTHPNEQRTNIPPMGLVQPENDPVNNAKKQYQYDPHLDPQLQWAGKAERTSFEVPTVSLHVHERIDPRHIIETIKKEKEAPQMSLFEDVRKKPLREAIEFYKHNENWSNRLIAGDSLLVMNSLLEKENMAGKVQMIYFDPPYGIKYGSNFMPFTNKRDVKDGKDEDLSSEPEMLKAFRDTWELGIHSYLSYIRDRMLLARELLSESGSVYVQISDENLHHIKEILDEIFGAQNLLSVITFKKTSSLQSKFLSRTCDFFIVFAKNIDTVKYRPLFIKKSVGEGTGYTYIELKDGTKRSMTKEEKENVNLLPKNSDPFVLGNLLSTGFTETCYYDFYFNGKIIRPGKYSWKTTKNGMENLISKGRVYGEGERPGYVQKFSDFPVKTLDHNWTDTGGASNMSYVVQTSEKVIQRSILMSSDPGDLILDITCGSGTSAFVAEQFGRRWITCDTSRIALNLAKQRLLTATYPFYKLAHPEQGVDSGFQYKTVPHVTLKSIANNEPPAQETLYDQPFEDTKRIRITGPFTVEAVPSPIVKSTLESELMSSEEEYAIEHTKATIRREDWINELLRSGVRGKNGQKLEFISIDALPGTTYLQAVGTTKGDNPQKVLICFGPEHAPLEQRTVELALEEAGNIKPKAHMILFCAFVFEEEAAKDIDETNWPGVQLWKALMNMDLQTQDLKKASRSNESFWFIGQPDVEVISHKDKEISIKINGFDYYDPKKNDVITGGSDEIAMWMIDPDYDGRAVFPAQVFLPLSGEKDGWKKLGKNLKAEIDEEKIEAFVGTESLPFVPGKKVAIKIIDNRGIESLKIIKF